MKTRNAEQLNKAVGLLKNRQYQACLEILDQLDVALLCGVEIGVYYLTRGEVLLFLGDYFHDYLDKAIDILKASSENWHFANAKYLKGWQLQSTGKPLRAKEPLVESYTAFLRIDDYNSAARALNRLAMISFQAGEIAQAIANLQRSIEYYDKGGNHTFRDSIKVNLALVHFMSGDFLESRLTYRKAGEAHSTFDQKTQCVLDLGHAMAMALSGDLANAKKTLHSTLKFLPGFKREEAQYYEYLGWISILDEDYESAEKALKKGLELSLEIAPESALVAQIQRLFADMYLATGKNTLAETAAKESLRVAEKIVERSEIAACYRVFAQLECRKGNAAKAREWYKKAIDLFSVISSRYELAVTRYLAAISGLYKHGERTAMLYLAKEYFESEDIKHYVDKIERELNRPQHFNPANGKAPTDDTNGCPTIIAVNARMKKILSLAEHIAPSDMSVLLTGQTGTGKDLLAGYIHYKSGRKGGFVSVNAAAVPASMVESELFGCAKGAYTGADKERPGLFEMADGGTFYLNEIADATPEFQAKLLEVLETKQVRRLGENKLRQVAFRLVAATNHDLNQRMRDGQFRYDLYHRLNEIPIHLPSLQERVDDIPALVSYFLKEMGLKSSNGTVSDIIRQFSMILQQRSWPGNIRELQATVKYVYVAAGGNPDRLVDYALGDGTRGEPDKLTELLHMTNWNRSVVASILGVSEGTVRHRIKKYGLK